jgi:integrase
MKGSVIEYRGKRGTVWRIKYLDASGKQVMETVGREPECTRKDAERELRHRLTDVERKGYRKPAPRTFASVLPNWEQEEATRNGWKAGTLKQYRTVVKRLRAYFGAMRLEAIRPSDVSAYVAQALATRAAATVCMDMTILHEIFAWAVLKEYRETNPAAGIPRPKVRQQKGHDLSPEQVQALLRSFEDEQARTAFLTFALTGIRRAELQGMRWRDVDLIENRLRIPDSKSDAGVRVVAIPSALADALWQHRRASAFQGDDERVFCHPEIGSEYHIGSRYKPALQHAFAKAGLAWPEQFRCCHDLRVTAITTDARNGVDPIAIMANAGHSSFSTTKRYIKLAGITFHDAAQERERRLLGLSTEPSTDLSAPGITSDQLTALGNAETALTDAA